MINVLIIISPKQPFFSRAAKKFTGMDIFQVIAHLVVSGTVHREIKSYFFFTIVVHLLVVEWTTVFSKILVNVFNVFS